VLQIARELRLRDIGGIIVVDFIDMTDEGNRDLPLVCVIGLYGCELSRLFETSLASNINWERLLQSLKCKI